jgi:hypothetical protein
MVPNVTTILQRFTTEWAALLQPEAILAACGEVGYIAWRHRVLTPVTTMQLFLLLKLTDFSGENCVKGLTIVAGEAILQRSRIGVPISRLPAGAGGLPHVPHHTRAFRP